MNMMPWAILSGVLLELVIGVVDRYAVRLGPYQVEPPFRVFQFGTITHDDGAVLWIFALKLPSWQWIEIDYGRRLGWGQLHFLWTSDRGWWFEYLGVS